MPNTRTPWKGEWNDNTEGSRAPALGEFYIGTTEMRTEILKHCLKHEIEYCCKTEAEKDVCRYLLVDIDSTLKLMDSHKGE